MRGGRRAPIDACIQRLMRTEAEFFNTLQDESDVGPAVKPDVALGAGHAAGPAARSGDSA